MSVVHIIQSNRAETEVWLDTGIQLHDGLCIGLGASMDAAVEDAVADLEAALEILKGPLAKVGGRITARPEDAYRRRR